ncbi:MAG: MFS transporter [Candidatus Omnitrophica bacterium]|nr:MFS transporter [Candidatus Omnitrophota bacterium]
MTDDTRKKAFQLIILFGMVSLFGDIIYEGARSVNGPYLKTLGASAALVGLIGGAGEFVGYAIRLVSGYFADRTHAYWFFTFLGYGLLVSVPLLALTGIWQVAAIFIVVERLGKALRSPAKDTILSQAAQQIGTGWGFGLNEAMDQIGALLGPLMFTLLFMSTGRAVQKLSDYQHGYALLWIPFVLLIACVVVAFRCIPNPEALEDKKSRLGEPEALSKIFWLYNAFSFLTAMGFIGFILMGYHFKNIGILTDAQIPFFYAIAMGVDGLAALVIGKYYDVLKDKHQKEHAGLLMLVFVPLVSALIPVLAFARSFVMVVVAVVLWGIVMGAHETIMKAAIADLTPLRKRGTGYGIFNATYGIAMLAGGALMGFLYDISVPLMVLTASLIQFAALPVFFMMKREIKR